MYAPLLTVAFVAFVAVITWLSFRLGKTKTENPTTAAVIGALLSLLPPFALIYVVVLSLKEDVAIV